MTAVRQFAWSSRILHWAMAVMLLAMLFIGVAMVASLADYHVLVDLHRPLGILILVFAVVRVVNRQLQPLPPFPETMSRTERFVAEWSERLMYTLMFALPLIGWGMLSAARYPIVMYGPIHLPPILPESAALYTGLRRAHTVLAYLLFFTFIAHLSAVLFHTFVIRDGLLKRMVPWNVPGPGVRNPAQVGAEVGSNAGRR
jgi:cytochrome b561